MTAPVLPFVPGAVRAFLAGSPAVTALVADDRMLTRAPANVSAPFLLVRSAGGALARDASAGAWSPLVQVEGIAPAGGQVDPEVVAWRIVAAAAAALARARNVTYQSMSWSARVTDGPFPDVDTSRGSSAPLYRALVRAELTLHAR